MSARKLGGPEYQGEEPEPAVGCSLCGGVKYIYRDGRVACESHSDLCVEFRALRDRVGKLEKAAATLSDDSGLDSGGTGGG